MNAVHHHPHPHHGGHHSHSHTDMPPPTSTGSVQDSQMFSPPNMVASKAQVHAQQQALAQAQAAAQVVANAMRGDKFGQQQQQHSQQHHQQQQHHQHHQQQQQQQQQQQTPNHQQHSHQHGQHTPSHNHGQHTPSQRTPNLQHTPTHHMNGSMGNMGGMGSMQNGMPPPQSTVSPTHKAAVVSATTPSATPTQNDISHAAEKVLQRAEISRMTRNLKSRLKLATFKTKRGWENLTFDTIEPRVDEEIKPMSPSSASSNTAGSANANATRSMYMTTTDQLSSPPLQQPFHPLSTPRFPPGNYPGSVHGPGGPQSPATLYDMGSPKAKMDHYPMLSPAKVPETRKRARTITSAPGTTASPRLHYSKSYQQLPFAMSQQHQQHALQQQQQHMFEQQQQVGFAQSQPMAKSQSMGALSQMKLSRDEIMNIDSELDKRERREREREQQQHQHQQEQQHQHQQQQHQHQQQQQQQHQHQRQHSHDESSQASHSLSNSSSQSAHSLGAALAGRSLEPPRTPPQKPRKLGVGSRDDANRDEGADLLMYLATSPSPAQRPSSSQPPWGASGGTPVQPTSAAAPQTPSQNFNFNDYLHMMTPSPAQVSHSPYHTERTPSTPNRLRLGQIPRSARRRLNFDKIPASPTSSERDSR